MAFRFCSIYYGAFWGTGRRESGRSGGAGGYRQMLTSKSGFQHVCFRSAATPIASGVISTHAVHTKYEYSFRDALHYWYGWRLPHSWYLVLQQRGIFSACVMELIPTTSRHTSLSHRDFIFSSLRKQSVLAAAASSCCQHSTSHVYNSRGFATIVAASGTPSKNGHDDCHTTVFSICKSVTFSTTVILSVVLLCSINTCTTRALLYCVSKY